MTNKVKKENILQLKEIRPKTKNQNLIFKNYPNKNLFICGAAGTGKTLCALYLAIQSVYNGDYEQVVIIRSAVPSRKQGFLPGSEEEKNEIFELPYKALVGEIFNKEDAYKQLKLRGIINFMSTSYLRGLTIDDAVIIIDEVQNCNLGEIHTVITRTGQNCKVIICGDEAQNDLLYSREESCMDQLHHIIYRMPSFYKVEMTVDDICRNGLVKEWITSIDS